jgi:hypothetical protein
LNNLPDDDNFWDNTPGGYDKAMCFRDHITIRSEREYKDWFEQEKINWGRSLSKLISRWQKVFPTELENFRNDFEKSFTHLKHKYNIN